MSDNFCSFRLIDLKSFYGLSYRVPFNGCRFFELIGSTGSASYSVSGFIDRLDSHDSFVVTGLESSRPRDAFYSALPDLSGVTDLSVIINGYSSKDSVIVDFCNFLLQKQINDNKESV